MILRTLSPFALVTLFAALGAIPVACGGKVKQADTPSPETDATTDSMGASTVITSPGSTTTAASDQGGSGGGGPLGTLLNGDPGKDQKTYDAATASPAAKLDPRGSNGNDTNAKKIAGLAKTAAPGMSPDGPMFKAKLAQGDHAQGDLTLKGGNCYTIIGYGDKIADLDLHLMVPPGVMSAQDSSDDAAPMIGKTPDAFCPSQDASYKLDMYAEKGGGDASVQVFSKKK